MKDKALAGFLIVFPLLDLNSALIFAPSMAESSLQCSVNGENTFIPPYSTNSHLTFPPLRKLNHILSIVLLLPPAPAALVLAGLAFATLSALSAAALRRSIVFTPPGGEDARAVVLPGPGEAATGGEGGGDDYG